MQHRLCIFPGCMKNATLNQIGSEDKTHPILWCDAHYGIYPHQCETYGCDRVVQYVDEPHCFTHSPDSGSSVPGYSAYKGPL
jgi:hypothetical protein